jgi:two-component system, NarL family, response regulator LiaR
VEIGALIVDDQADIRRLIRLIIENADDQALFVSGEAASGKEAITAADDLKPAVVLMDYMMPDMDGIDAAREILFRRPDQTVILCTGFLDQALEARARDAGIAAILSKTEFHRIPVAVREAAAGDRAGRASE